MLLEAVLGERLRHPITSTFCPGGDNNLSVFRPLLFNIGYDRIKNIRT